MKDKTLERIMWILGFASFFFCMWAIWIQATSKSINSISKQELMQIEYVGEKTADDIIKNRPYKNMKEVEVKCKTVGDSKYKKILLHNYGI